MPRRRDLAEVLQGVPLFARCTPRELRTIARFVATAELPAGTHLVREGEAGDALFVILEGEALIMTGDRELARVKDGDYVGELALLDGAPRAADVIAAPAIPGRPLTSLSILAKACSASEAAVAVSLGGPSATRAEISPFTSNPGSTRLK